jgi:2-oxoglutarate ferredoxin oxidoreductase subunit beta
MAHLQERQAVGEVVTGLLYVDPNPEDLHAHLGTVTQPLNRMNAKELCPGSAALKDVNAGYR